MCIRDSGHAVLLARREHGLGVEGGLGPAPAGDDPAGAVAEHVHVRVGHGGAHPPGHGRRRHPQLRVHARHHHVEAAQQVGVLVEAAVGEDVHLDAGEDAERGQLGVAAGHHVQLCAQSVGGQAVGDGQPRRVVGERQPLVAQVAGGLGHLLDGAAAVGPVGVGVAVAAQRGPQRLPAGHRPGLGAFQQAGQVAGLSAPHRLGDHLAGAAADAGQVGERAPVDPVAQLLGGQAGDGAGGAAERVNPVGGFTGSLQLEGDLAQCRGGVHVHRPTRGRPGPQREPGWGDRESRGTGLVAGRGGWFARAR